jgi:hypothetical protein
MDDVDLNKQGAAHSSAPTKTNGGRPDRRSLDRLLRAASRVDVDLAPEMPFGFDTRVVANSRGPGLTNGNGLTRLLRRVALVAAAILLASGAAAVHEFAQARELNEPLLNEYALADSAIQTEMSR